MVLLLIAHGLIVKIKGLHPYFKMFFDLFSSYEENTAMEKVDRNGKLRFFFEKAPITIFGTISVDVVNKD